LFGSECGGQWGIDTAISSISSLEVIGVLEREEIGGIGSTGVLSGVEDEDAPL